MAPNFADVYASPPFHSSGVLENISMRGNPSMPVVYVAGPFRAHNRDGVIDAWGVHLNVVSAMRVALEVWRMGACCICPHANSIFFQGADGCMDNVWLDGDMEMLRRCDALMCAPGCEESRGARAEHVQACQWGIPCFADIPALRQWVDLWFAGHSRKRGTVGRNV